MRKNSPFSRPAWKGRIRKEIQAAARVLILGVGNLVKGDDAAGLVCAGKLKKLMRGKARPRLRILLGYETPENLTGKIRKFDPDLVLILDAAAGQYEPGNIFIVEKERIQDEGASAHRISLALLISYLEETVGCKVIVLGIQPLNLSLSQGVSGPVKKSVAGLAEHLAHILTRYSVLKS